jgi:hypothetical protein
MTSEASRTTPWPDLDPDDPTWGDDDDYDEAELYHGFVRRMIQQPRPRSSGPLGSWPTHARQLLEAREGMELEDAIVVAVRAGRGRRGQSQRAFAHAQDLGHWVVEALEKRPGKVKLGLVLQVLAELGFGLALVRRDGASEDRPMGQGDALVHPDEWSAAELIARDVAGRRLPAHRPARRTGPPASWVRSDDPRWARLTPLWTWSQNSPGPR